ncbi:hypothetical protein BaRGS_00039385 [Batillaria attramentaria]|uniref:Uncharacterized protein n=1 Tax=Batillaria attramentaria TaxID=370345 RepID=A0ABD0J3D6_9CAEN
MRSHSYKTMRQNEKSEQYAADHRRCVFSSLNQPLLLLAATKDRSPYYNLRSQYRPDIVHLLCLANIWSAQRHLRINVAKQDSGVIAWLRTARSTLTSALSNVSRYECSPFVLCKTTERSSSRSVTG